MSTISSANDYQKSWKERFLNLFGLTGEPIIKLYHGYGYQQQLTIFGHVLRLSPLPRTRYTKSILNNTWALLRLFVVQPYPKISVEMCWEGNTYNAETGIDGFFKFEWTTSTTTVAQGWIEVTVKAVYEGKTITESRGHIYIPYQTQYGFISDIDDTFLISHSSELKKRLFVLFTKNARSRKPFESVVKHYQLLTIGNTTPDAPNPFFYVSSSEWNLYDYLLEFTSVNGLPKGVFLLNQLKVFSQILKTGQNNHQTKFTRIARILESYPNQQFVLLGDSSQQDPYIYQAIVSHFPKQIYAVYIRDVRPSNHQKVKEVAEQIEVNGIPCCLFRHSSEAIMHSVKIGLVEAQDSLIDELVSIKR